ncbi:MAG TPA: HIT domain-containing protein [Candidatus Methylomirabilis sp.]|nr:HIT domain-containing protein [Candidatus Methylomirabilis sp.]
MGQGRTGCVFCGIRDGRLPASRLAENGRAFAIMDIHPLSDGHTLIIPTVHSETLFEIGEEDWLAVASLARRVAGGIRKGLSPDGLSLIQANGRAAFQSIPHFHLHLIPRWDGDSVGFDWPLVPGDPERIRSLADKIRASL